MHYVTNRTSYNEPDSNSNDGRRDVVGGSVTRLVIFVNQIYITMVIAVGLIGNLYCLYAIPRSPIRKLSSGQYLLALACSDLGFLITLAITLLAGAGIDWYNWNGVCQVVNYASYVCCFLSGWYVVALTAERCLVVYRPFYARTLTSKPRARTVVVIITAVGLTLNAAMLTLMESQTEIVPETETDLVQSPSQFSSPTGQGSEVNGGDNHGQASTPTEALTASVLLHTGRNRTTYSCTEVNESVIYEAFTTVDTVVSFGAPFALICLFNLVICLKLFRANRERRHLAPRHSSSAANTVVKCQRLKRLSCSTTTVYCDSNAGRSIGGAADAQPSSQPPAQQPPLSRQSTPFVDRQISIDDKSRTTRAGSTAVLTTTAAAAVAKLSQNKERQVTVLLLSISLTYLLLNVPSYIGRIVRFFWQVKMMDDHESIIMSLLYMPFYTQFAINFIFYSCQSRNLRRPPRRESNLNYSQPKT